MGVSDAHDQSEQRERNTNLKTKGDTQTRNAVALPPEVLITIIDAVTVVHEGRGSPLRRRCHARR